MNDVRNGDIIVSINGEQVTSLADAHRLLEGTGAVQLCVRRNASEEDEFEDFSEEDDEPVAMVRVSALLFLLHVDFD